MNKSLDCAIISHIENKGDNIVSYTKKNTRIHRRHHNSIDYLDGSFGESSQSQTRRNN